MPPEQVKFSKFDAVFSDVYSGRAECQHDILEVLKMLQPLEDFRLNSVNYHAISLGEIISPDVGFQFTFAKPVNHGQLLRVIDQIVDCHVIVQTLEPCVFKANGLGRDFSRF